MRAIRKVLVPLDGSRQSETILAPAIELHEATGCELVFLYVHTPGSGDRPPADGYLAELRTALAERVKGDIGVLEATGSPAQTIADQAAAVGADLIALSPHGTSGLIATFLGNVAYKLLRLAPVPVLSHRYLGDGEEAPRCGALLERVLIPCDGSELSLHAVETLKQLAGERRPEVVLLYVAEPGERSLERPPSEREALQAARQACTGAGFVVRCDVRPGRDIAKTINDCAQRHGATLVALATHGRGVFMQLALGSVAYDVVRTSPRPVLVVR